MQTNLLILSVLIVLLQFLVIVSFSDQIIVPDVGELCFNETCGVEFNPYSPLINCSYLSDEFVNCGPPEKCTKNETSFCCQNFGGQTYEEVERTRVWCEVIEGIECYGERRFLSVKTQPCLEYNGHYFVTTLIYSVLLGFLGMDRFCLGHTGTAVGKLLTIGGVGIWWIVDIILLVTGILMPADGSNWEPTY